MLNTESSSAQACFSICVRISFFLYPDPCLRRDDFFDTFVCEFFYEFKINDPTLALPLIKGRELIDCNLKLFNESSPLSLGERKRGVII